MRERARTMRLAGRPHRCALRVPDACVRCAGLMGELVPPNRKALAVYPLFLFYTSIGWLILIAAKRS